MDGTCSSHSHNCCAVHSQRRASSPPAPLPAFQLCAQLDKLHASRHPCKPHCNLGCWPWPNTALRPHAHAQAAGCPTALCPNTSLSPCTHHTGGTRFSAAAGAMPPKNYSARHQRPLLPTLVSTPRSAGRTAPSAASAPAHRHHSAHARTQVL